MTVTALHRTTPRHRAIAAISDLIGDRLTINAAIRLAHGRGEAFHPDMLPDAVAFPETRDEVVLIVRICAEAGVPIIPFGAGSSLEGNVAAPFGGVSIDLTRMNRVIAVHQEDLDCIVQPGVTREQLNAELRDQGLFFPIDPGANATLGGMCATRASGTNAVRYGTMRDNVLWLEVVMADGRVIRTARRARKSSAGYDLTRLFVGSEGTLGIITAIGLRLHGIPEAVSVATCAFDDVRGAIDTVVMALQIGVPVARVEFMDAAQIDATNRYSHTDLPLKPTLLFEFHGTDASVKEQADTVGTIAADFGGRNFVWATVAEERSALWKARHNAYFAAQALRPGSQLVVSDVCVPISRLTDCIAETHTDIAESDVVAPIVGHVGDGNFHVFFTVNPADPAEVAHIRALNDRLVARALAMDGTCTGEHGIGLGKQGKLVDELGEDTVSVMRAVKAALDPQGLFNPGKIFRAAAPAG
jgi:D-lactate dehydrogenase (cytochrome)